MPLKNRTEPLPLLAVVFAAGVAAASACQPASASPSTTPGAFQDPVASAESLQAGNAVLRGTLLSPVRSVQVPVALIIAGSGPTDRDGNSAILPGKNNSLKLLAEGLAAQGIASLRYDKRGTAQSSLGASGEAELTFGTFADDATAWGQQLRRDPRFSEVVVVGHSEGGLLGILAAPRIPASKLVSVAGLGRPAGVVLREQLGRQLDSAMMKTVDSILTVLEQGGSVANVPPMLHVLFRPSVQPYLASFLRVTPAEEVARLELPVLVIHGTTDEQIARADATVLAAASPRAELRLFEGMNHVLKTAPRGLAQQTAAYTDSTIALAPGLVDTIAAFINRR